MNLKSNAKKKRKINLNSFLKVYFFLSIFIISSLSLLFFNTGYWKNYKNEFLHRLHVSSVYNYIYLPKILYNGFKSKFYKIDKINLNISFENVINLENQRSKVIKKGGLIKNFTEVPATVDFEGKKYRIDLRLKGDRFSHYNEKDNLSYRLYLKDSEKIFGLRKFSLQKPRMRNYIHEWVFHKLISETDLINIKYEFIELSVNGSNSSLYNIEEGFDKILIERNKRRNGPIFSLQEELSAKFHDSNFEIYNKSFWLSSEHIIFTDSVRAKLEKFRDGGLEANDIFDIDKWAKFFAITDLNYYSHATAAKSVRFYYNPVSALFEPIGYDAHRGVPNYSKYIKNWNSLPINTAFEKAERCSKDITLCKKEGGRQNGDYFLYKIFFKKNKDLNDDFYQLYQSYILKFSSMEYLDKFFDKNNYNIERINNLIYGDYYFVDHLYFYGPGIYYFTKEDIYKRASDLRQKYSTNLDKLSVYQKSHNLEIVNLLKNNNILKLNKLDCKDKNTGIYKQINLKNNKIKNLKNLLIEEKFEDLNLVCNKIFFFNEKNNLVKKNINHKFDINYSTNLQNDSYKEFFFQDRNNLKLINSNTIIGKNIQIPENFIVKILPGQSIRLLNNAFIFSKSPWNANGKKKQIEISGLKDNFGGGIYIENTVETSFFNNVNFKYLSGLKKPYFYNKNNKYLTTKSSYVEKNSFNEVIDFSPDQNMIFNMNYNLMGSINIFNSIIKIENANFEKICSEDAINIISSKFFFENVSFSENCSDSIDIDFGIGEIHHAEFKHIGNDAIDLSGSFATLENIVLNNVGDKFISIGEESNVNISKMNGNNSYVGIASKDGSITKLNNINLNNVKIALASYVKKNEYENAKILAEKIEVNNEIIYDLSDLDSEIIINGKKMDTKNKNILRVIYNKDLSLIN